jgi:hypothetical protein
MSRYCPLVFVLAFFICARLSRLDRRLPRTASSTSPFTHRQLDFGIAAIISSLEWETQYHLTPER